MNSVIPLQIDSVCFSYSSKQILEDITFNVHPGSFTVLLGINGAGKTTLFSLITRLYSPGSGHITVFGNDLEKQSKCALSEMGVVFQNSTLDQDLTIRQNLLYHAALYDIPASQADQFLLVHFDRYLPDCRLNQKVNELSGGQKRSVELLRALVHQPRLLILDEPTVGLDISNRSHFIRNVRDLCQKEKIGVLWATHLVDEVAMTDDIIILHKSRVLASGKVHALLSDCGTENVNDAFVRLADLATGRNDL